MASEKHSPRSEIISDWYNQLLIAAEITYYAPVCSWMVVRLCGWALWENLPAAFDQRINAAGHVNATFTLFIPLSFLERKKGTVAGYSLELAGGTIGAGQIFEEPVVVRPTSETIIGYLYVKWIKSYRDLAVFITQWGNVIRREMRMKLFLRTLKFYWQERYAAHGTKEEVQEETPRMLDVFADFAIKENAVPANEKAFFARAD